MHGRNRVTFACLGAVLALGGGLAVLQSAGVFGASRADETIFDPTVVRWWHDGHWVSYLVVGVVGVLAVAFGLNLAVRQFGRSDGKRRASNFTFGARGAAAPEAASRGRTDVRAAALSHGLEVDLRRQAGVDHALVGLFGTYPELEMQTVLTVEDDADLDGLPAAVASCTDRFFTTTGIRLAPVAVTIRFTASSPTRGVR